MTQAAAPHRLHLAIAHAGEVGTDRVAGGLEHPLLDHERLRVEARPPRLAALRVDADGRVHAADLEPKLGDRRLDHVGRAAGKLDVHGGLRHCVDADVQVEQMRVDRWSHRAGVRITADRAVVGMGPDRHAAALAAAPVEEGGEPLALAGPAGSYAEAGICGK